MVTIREASIEDAGAVIGTFNHYVKEGFSAFPENPLPPQAFGMLMDMSKGYPFLVIEEGGSILGWGMLHAYNRMPTFKHTAEVSYFLHPEHRRKGLGSLLLRELTVRGKAMGIENFLAQISSLNEESLSFHKKMGFSEVGRFKGVLRKKGRELDIVWMQRRI